MKPAVGKLVCVCALAGAVFALVNPDLAARQGVVPKGLDEATYRHLEFRGIGPAVMGGRISDIEAVERDPRIIYVGVASGGVWKTTDSGTTWTPIFDQGTVSSIGDIAIAPSDSDVIWVGTGEESGYGSAGWGNGVYKSRDGGKTWAHVGLADTHAIGRVVIDPQNAEHVYVAAAGHMWGPNKERGVFETKDGGKSWRHLLALDEMTGVLQLALAPDDPLTLYAAAFRIPRRGRLAPTQALLDQAGEPDQDAPIAPPQTEPSRAGIYKSTDGGSTWRRLTNGLPDAGLSRVGLDICRSRPSVLYAVISAQGIFRSDDRGETWRKTNPLNTSRYAEIRVDPSNAERVWMTGADPLFYSENGGRTFCASEDGNVGTYCQQWLERIHFDTHALWINPRNSDYMILGTDGGVYITQSRGRTWDYIQTMPLGQFYQIGYDMQDPYYVYGGKQDTGTWSGPSRSMWMMGITNEDWFGVLVGDGYFVSVDPTDPDTIYAEYQGGRYFRINRRTWERRDIRPMARKGEPEYRFLGGNHPLLISPHDPKTIFVAGNRLFTSKDRGETWSESRDLTQRPDGNGHITSVSESPLKPGLLWVGTDDGCVQVSRDAGTTWRNIAAAIPNVPPGMYVQRVVASSAGEGAAYVAFNGHWVNDFTPYVYRTTDFGATWTSVRGDLPDGVVIKVLREHPRNPNLLFIGTEFGLYVSFDRGVRWLALRNGLPPARIDDLYVHPRENDLVVGTHGRSIYILDDITPLEQLSDAVLASDFHLFDMRPATMYRLYNHRTNLGPGDQVFIAPNPPYGALISYYLRSEPAAGEQARIQVLGPQGQVIRELTGPADKGINRTAWDLHYGTPLQPRADLRPDPPGQPGGPRMRLLMLTQGPLVLPGDYTVRVSVGGREMSKILRVKEDPRVQLDDAELRAHREAWHRAARLYLAGNVMYRRANELRTAVLAWDHDTPGRPRAVPQALQTSIAAIRKQLEAIEPRLGGTRGHQALAIGYIDPGTGLGGPLTNRAGQLLLTIGYYTARPTPRQTDYIEELTAELGDVRDQLNALIEVEIPKFNRQARAAKLPELAPGELVPPLK